MHKVELKQFIQANIPTSEQIVLQIGEQFDAYTILKTSQEYLKLKVWLKTIIYASFNNCSTWIFKSGNSRQTIAHIISSEMLS